LFDIAHRAGQVARIEVDHNNSRLRSPLMACASSR
jgi:hypothetical protein